MFRSAPAPAHLIAFSSATCIANGLWTIYWMGVAILSEIKCGPPHQACDETLIPILMYLLGEAFLFIPTMLGGVVLVALQTASISLGGVRRARGLRGRCGGTLRDGGGDGAG